jgi:hypothetical protein
MHLVQKCRLCHPHHHSIFLSPVVMPASPGDPSEWEHFSWTFEQQPTSIEIIGSSGPSGSSLSANGVTVQTEDPDGLLALTRLHYEISGVHNRVATVRGAGERISHSEWLCRHPTLPRRPQYGLLKMIVVRISGWLGHAGQKFIDIWRWIKG